MSLEIASFIKRVQDDSGDVERGVVGELVVLFGLIPGVVRRKTKSGFYTMAVNVMDGAFPLPWRRKYT
jgi:hypothetical protein